MNSQPYKTTPANTLNHPILTISLDFELLWGVFDKVGSRIDDGYFRRTRALIPRMLEIFARHQVEVTWATVGMLFCANEEEWEHYKPAHLPSYREKGFSAYHWAKENGLNPAYHFAPDLIQQILETPGQELGSHSYAHYYTLLRGQTPVQFREDLQTAQRISRNKFGVSLKSLVFPRNHVNLLYLDTCAEEGFDQVRSNPELWYWQEAQHEGLLKKIFRSADCYVPFAGHTTYPLEKIYHWEKRIWLMPASRLLKHYAPFNPLSNVVRMQRAKGEMAHAAEKNEVYHIWWHPHNFAHDPDGALKELEKFLAYFENLRDRYGMQSHSMATLGEKLKGKSKHLQVT
jgi:peptidoglycan/xylan/chitin deacetylase (PgdA/CDA1 family)